MKSKTLTVTVDADALIAQINAADAHHQAALKISQFLLAQQVQVMYPVTAIVEATTYIQRVLQSPRSAYDTANLFTDSQLQVIEVNQEILKKAYNYFSPRASKKHTLFDCIVAAVAEIYQADAIFSFDKFYKQKGFTLASDLDIPEI